jgi:hypothetical protein
MGAVRCSMARMNHEKNEISEQEVKFYCALNGEWKTSSKLAEMAKISPRTSRMYSLKFVRLGLADRAEVFPAHRYRLSDKAGKRNISYVQRLEEARAVFGL